MGSPKKNANRRRRRARTRVPHCEQLDPRWLLACTSAPGGGDYNSNGICDPSDIESLSQVVRLGTGSSLYDLNLDGHFDQEDRQLWIQSRAGTWYGDVNVDRSFDANDLAKLQASTEYADTKPLNSTWGEGDFTGDGEFDAWDWVAAMQGRGYGRGPFSGAAVPLPEPSSQPLLAPATKEAGDVELAYDAATGTLEVRSMGSLLTAFYLTSRDGRFSSNPTALRSLSDTFDRLSGSELFHLQPAGFQRLSLGPLLPAGLPVSSLLSDLEFTGANVAGPLNSARLRYVTAPDATEPANNALVTADALSPQSPFRLARSLHRPGDVDWYRWDVSERGTLHVDSMFSEAAGNGELELYDSLGVLLRRSSTDQANEHLDFAVLPGETYYARVSERSTSPLTNYDLLAYQTPESPRAYVLTTTQVVVLHPEDLTRVGSAIELPLQSGDHPQDIELSAQGLLYVSVSNSRRPGRILELSPQGVLIREISLPADPGILVSPRGFEVLSDGTLLIAEPNRREVVRLDRDSVVLERRDAPPSLSAPDDVTVAVDDRSIVSTQGLISPLRTGGHWLANTADGELQRFDANNQVVERLSAVNALDVQQAPDGALYYVTSKQVTKLSADTGRVPLVRSISPAPVAVALSHAEYAVAPQNVLRDQDGDSLPDEWELHGLDLDGDGRLELDLPALGANPRHKDLFVEIDAMSGRAPLPATLARVVQAFAQAPATSVVNPDGKPGITLHLEEYSREFGRGSADTTIPIEAIDGDTSDAWNRFYQLKSLYFGTGAQRGNADAAKILSAKSQVYRYALFADKQGHSGGSALVQPLGRNLMLTLGDWATPGGTAQQQAALFMHFLGRMLGLRDGGQDDIAYKPNYLSVMNPAHLDGGSVVNGLPFLDFSRYSPDAADARLRAASLDERQLDERVGLGLPTTVNLSYQLTATDFAASGAATDWNRQGGGNQTGIAFDVNYFRAGELLQSHDDWSDLDLDLKAKDDVDPGVDEPTLGAVSPDVCDNFYPGGSNGESVCDDDKMMPQEMSTPTADVESFVNSVEDLDWYSIFVAVAGVVSIELKESQFAAGFEPPVDLTIEKDVGDGCVPVDAAPAIDGTTRQWNVNLPANSRLYMRIAPGEDFVNSAPYRLTVTVPAVESVWVGPPGPQPWSSPGNWLGNEVPVPGAQIVFPAAAGETTVDLQGTRAVGKLTIDRNLNVAGGTVELLAATVQLDDNATATWTADVESELSITQVGGHWVANGELPDWTVSAGRLSGVGSIASLVVMDDAQLSPGDAVGELDVAAYAEIHGDLMIDVAAGGASPESSQGDQIAVTEDVWLDATNSHLVLQAAGGPGAPGEFSWQVLSTGGFLIGQFATTPDAEQHLGSGLFHLATEYVDDPAVGAGVWAHLRQAQAGDANGDGRFDSSDLVVAFIAGTYELDQPADWTQGDWDGDGRFNSNDLILALQLGGYTDAATQARAAKSVRAGAPFRRALIERRGGRDDLRR